MPMHLSHRAKAIEASPTLQVSALAKKMQSKGLDVINFGVGEPDFNTPQIVKDEAKRAIDENFTRYTATSGIKELKEAISAKLKRDNGLNCRTEDILVSPGAKASIIHVLLATCDPRDEILIPSPYWVSYTSQVEMVDAHPVLLNTNISSKFRITPKQLEDTLKEAHNPKAIILNSPNNPTGTIYSKRCLENIAEICLKYDILIISDEIYEKLTYDGEEHISIASISPEVRENTILINGVSKAYAMTGWRLGYAAGPTRIIKRASLIQSHTTSCVNSMTQKAAIKALSYAENEVQKMKKVFEERRNFIYDELMKIDEIKCFKPRGAFYIMPNVAYYIRNNNKNIENTIELCEYLLKEYHIALVPGLAFGAKNFLRFSYANSMENLKTGLKRFKKGLKSLIS